MRLWLPSALAAGMLLAGFGQVGSITTGPTRITNSYPEQMAFEVDVSSSVPISRVELHVSVRGETSTTVIVATFASGAQTTARAEWKTRRDGVPPGAPYTFAWRIWDDAGNTLTTDAQQGLVLDPRRTWSERKDERVGVWWYEGEAAFGERIFQLATTSLRAMERESGLEIPLRLHVVLYPDAEAFAEWHDYVLDWVGGEAYTTIGLTVQIISPSDSEEWIQSVICHEVAHLFFFPATNNALSLGPATWISEGYAQVHECVSNEWLGQRVEEALLRGELIPLRLATGSFSGDDERVWLLYAESWSAMTFLYERWGDDGVARLLEAFRDGADDSDALRAATGLDFEEYQQAWWEWLGGAPGAYPTPPPPVTEATTATPAPRASPTPEMATASAASATEDTSPVGTRGGWPCSGGAAALLVTVVLGLPASRAARRRASNDR